MENNVIVFLQAVELVGGNDGIVTVLLEDLDFSEVRVSLIDIIHTDQLLFFPQSKLIAGIGPLQDLTVPENGIIQIVFVIG